MSVNKIIFSLQYFVFYIGFVNFKTSLNWYSISQQDKWLNWLDFTWDREQTCLFNKDSFMKSFESNVHREVKHNIQNNKTLKEIFQSLALSSIFQLVSPMSFLL